MAKHRVQILTWYGFSAVLLAMFAITVGYGVVLPILPFLIERVTSGAGAAAVSRHTGLLTAVYVVAIFAFAPLWGRFSDRNGRRPVILTGLLGVAVTTSLLAVVESLPLLYMGRFLSGAFAAAIAPVAYALVGDHAASREWRAHRFAVINIAATAGFFVGPLLGGLVHGSAVGFAAGASAANLSAPFIAAAALAFAAALAVWTFAPGSRAHSQPQTSMSQNDMARSLLMRLWLIALVTAFAVGAFEVGLSVRGKQVLGLDPARIGMMFSECSIVMLIVQTLVFSPLIKPEVTRLLIVPALAVLAGSLIVVSLTQTSIATTVGVALVAASAGVISPIVTYWASLGRSETQAADLGRMTAAASLGQAFGSAGGGLLADVTFVTGGSFVVAAVVVSVGLLVGLRLPQLLLPKP